MTQMRSAAALQTAVEAACADIGQALATIILALDKHRAPHTDTGPDSRGRAGRPSEPSRPDVRPPRGPQGPLIENAKDDAPGLPRHKLAGTVPRDWTPAEDAELARLWALKLKTPVIAAKLGRTSGATEFHAHKLKLPGRKGFVLSDSEAAAAVAAAAAPKPEPAPVLAAAAPKPKPAPVKPAATAPTPLARGKLGPLLEKITPAEKRDWPGLHDAVRVLHTTGRQVEKSGGHWLLDRRMVGAETLLREAAAARRAA